MKKLFSVRLLQHLAFWACAFYVLFKVFSSSDEVLQIDILYTFIFILTLLPGIYLNLMLLIPHLLGKRKYILFGIAFAVLAIGSTALNIVVFSRFIDYLLPGYYFISYYEFFDLLKFVLALMGVTSLLKLSKGWFLLMDTESKLAVVEKENTETRLLALKSQLNPHFLFNSLSGIYNLVLKQSPETPTIVLRLSDFLRHILYEAEADRVSLAVELAAMSDYVELQRIRSGAGVTISLEIKGDPGSYKIAPLLLLPLLENSFKHGVKGAVSNTYANFEFIIEAGFFIARLTNNKGVSIETDSKYKGIGLKNLKQRLDLLYPENHKLSVTESNSEFIVELKVPLDE
ncbi:MAG: histidine kinase [Bacteroidales bacterium]|nr:histidine kinase [Bacteroidales bacterium]